MFTVLHRVYTRRLFGDAPELMNSHARDTWRMLPMPLKFQSNSTLLFCSNSQQNLNVGVEQSVVRLDDVRLFRVRSEDNYIFYMGMKGRTSTDDFDSQQTSGEEISGNKIFQLGVKSQSTFDINDANDDSNAHSPTVRDDESAAEDESASDFEKSSNGGNERNDVGDGDETYQFDLPENECLATSIAVFVLTDGHGSKGIQLLDYMTNCGKDKYIGKFALHPNLPLMVLHCGSESRGTIVLWNLKSLPCAENRMPSNFRFQTLVESIHWVETLHFSDCGTQIIYTTYAGIRPAVVPVHETLLYKSVNANFQTPKKHTIISETLKNRGPISTSLSQTQVLLHKQGSSTALEYNPGSSQTDLELVRSHNGSQILQTLLTLPSRADARFARINMLSTRRVDDTKLRFVITKTPRLFSEFPCAANETPTAIVEKDTRTLLNSRKRTFDGTGYLWKAMPPIIKFSNEAFQPQLGDGVSRKKLRSR